MACAEESIPGSAAVLWICPEKVQTTNWGTKSCSMGNGNRPTPEFRREAVRLGVTSGRTRREIAEDPGIGLSTLARSLGRERDAGETVEASVDLHPELKRLRGKNAVLKQERDIIKKNGCLRRERRKSMSFAFIEAENASIPSQRMCRVPSFSQSGFFAWRDHPVSLRQRQDMVHLAHKGTTFSLSNGTYGSSRMHRDLLDEGHQIGRHRTAHLMKENKLVARQKRRFKRTTDS